MDLHTIASTAAAPEVPKRALDTHSIDDAAAAGVCIESLTQVPCDDHEDHGDVRKAMIAVMVATATALHSYLLCDVHLFTKQ